MEQTKTKDGVPLRVGSIPKTEAMYFYRRKDGSVFNVSEKDAAKIHTKFEYVGRTDGNNYMNTIKDLQSKFQELTMAEIQQGMRDAMKREEESAQDKTPPRLLPLMLNIKEQIFPPGLKDSIK